MSDRNPLRNRVIWLSLAVFLLNAAVVWRLFHTEYISQTGTVEGVFIAYARYARDHWPDLSWCRFWYAGLPFQNAYVPGLHLTVAAASALTHVTAAAAFHFVTALLYSLGPVTLFWMAYRLTGAPGSSFCAALLYSLTSPSALLIPDIRRDLGGLFHPQRLHTMVGYSDGPHVASLTLIPLAILAVDWALARRRPIPYVLAALVLAAIPLTNWPGTIVLAFAMIAYALSRGEWPRILGISALAYAFAIPWIPPSTILTTQADTQKLEPVNQFGWHHLVYVAALAALTYGLLQWFARRKTPRYLRFFVLFLFYMAAITLGQYWLGVTLIAQPHRFHLAMEMGLIVTVVFMSRSVLDRRPRLRLAITGAVALVCAFQFVEFRLYARQLIRPIDMTRTSEYKTARWFDQHMRQGRVMVPGSTTFWLNAFTDTPQLTGCCPQGVVDRTILFANYGINTDLTAESRGFENSLLWFKALGVRAVAVSGPNSTEVYKPFYHPEKFSGRLPVLWRDGDDVIYDVPSPAYSLAHAIDRARLVRRRPLHGVDTAPLIPYVEAIEQPGAALPVRWTDNETLVIAGQVGPGKIVSLQVTAHPGWHATVDGAPRQVFADNLGFLAVVPQCSGKCTIRLHYDGGMEMVVAHWIGRAAFIGAFFWVAFGFLDGLRRSRAHSLQYPAN